MTHEFKIPSQLGDLEVMLEQAMLLDVRKLKKQWHKIQGCIKKDQPASELEAQFQRLFIRSSEQVLARKGSVPEVVYTEGLPISLRHSEIAESIEGNQVIILAGETGSGKTTQLPKICLALGRGVRGQIGHTQPRRIAASAVASRIAEELKTSVGESVGFQVRFTANTSATSHIKLMTDGILLAEIQRDPLLFNYDTIIIDEAHERSLNIDFLLGYLKQILSKRPDLKLIITSATIDLDKFSKHFNDAPIIEVSGRTFPVDILYRPWAGDTDEQSQAVVQAVEEILAIPNQQNGDILVFMSGERDIRETAQAIRKANFPQLDVLPLYARLSLADQKRVFQNHKGRRIVLATNVAETSITVPRIGFVIDPGYARVSRYSVRTKVQRLPIEAISQASANQRAGRCGRVSHGVCIRLYEEEDFNTRPEFTDAEIVRTNLASVVLKMIHLGIGDIRKFPFVDAPDPRFISDGYKLLEELQAVDAKGGLTKLGRQIAGIPLDPKLARMVLAATQEGCLKEVLVITSALSIQDPRERPSEKRQAADEKHRRFWDESSDFVAYLNLWTYAEGQRQDLSQNQWSKLCKKEFLSFLRMREWRELHHQVKTACKKIGLKENTEAAGVQSVHKALLSGLLGNIGLKSDEDGEQFYLGARNRKFTIFPGSSQFKKRPKWIMTAELLETSKLFAHGVAKIEADWVLELAKHIVKHHYYQPHYNVKSGQVVGFDRVTLFGLVLVEKKLVNYSDIDAVVAREVFIRSALAEGGYGKSRLRKKGRFFASNAKSIEDVNKLEAKSRRRDIMVDDEVLYQFYDERIPAGIVNLSGFEHWRKSAEAEQPNTLIIPSATLMHHDAGNITEAQFPDSLNIDGMVLPLSYHFEPHHADDGVSVGVPAGILHTIPEYRLDWLVPGLLRDKCIALVKSLPKQWRKQFVPVPHYVDQVLSRMSPSNKPLVEVLQQELQRVIGKQIPEDLWCDITVEPFYLMNIQILDERQKVIDRDRSLTVLRDRYRDHVQATLQSAGEELERTAITDWSFRDLPETCVLKRNGVDMRAFPALVVEKDGVALRMLDNPIKAHVLSQSGVVELLSLKFSSSVKYLQKSLLKNKDIGLSIVSIGARGEVVKSLIAAAIFDVCIGEAPIPRSEQDFEAAAERGKSKLVECANDYEKVLLSILVSVVKIRKCMKESRNGLMLTMTFGDIQSQLNTLIYPDFLFLTPMVWLQQYPRYLKAILVRLEKAPLDIQKDKKVTHSVGQYWSQHSNRLEKEGLHSYQMNPSWQSYRWMIEELRVSLFAQTLKTKVPVSEVRLNKCWADILK